MMLWFVLACGSKPDGADTPPPPVTADEADCKRSPQCRIDCDAGDALACNQLALWTHDGMMSTVHSVDDAAELYRRSCDLGAGIGCYNLSQMRATGESGPANPSDAKNLLDEARRLYQASCNAGGLTWCINLAGLLARGELGKPDPRAARSLLDDTCNNDGELACVELAEYLFAGIGGQKDVERGEALLLDACDAGSAQACNNLGRHVETRGGDPTEIFRKSCDRGVPVACRNLARLIPERTEALALLEKACDAPQDLDGVSCAMAAELLIEEPGNEAQAVERLKRACSVGIAATCKRAVDIGMSAKVLPEEQARLLLQRGCALGDAPACADL